jgi:DNA-binding NarL/FixJ family response regulator
MTAQIKALVAMDADVDRDLVQSALPSDSAIQIVGLVDGLEESWATLQETPTDLLVVACAGYSDRALFLIDGAVRQRPERPVVVLVQGSANGFVRRVFESGADDILTLPQSQETVAFTMHKAVARKLGASAGSGVALSPMICVLGPKGGTGKTLTPNRAARSPSSTSTSNSVTSASPSGLCPRRPSTTSRSRAARSTRTSSTPT